MPRPPEKLNYFQLDAAAGSAGPLGGSIGAGAIPIDAHGASGGASPIDTATNRVFTIFKHDEGSKVSNKFHMTKEQSKECF